MCCRDHRQTHIPHTHTHSHPPQASCFPLEIEDPLARAGAFHWVSSSSSSMVLAVRASSQTCVVPSRTRTSSCLCHVCACTRAEMTLPLAVHTRRYHWRARGHADARSKVSTRMNSTPKRTPSATDTAAVHTHPLSCHQGCSTITKPANVDARALILAHHSTRSQSTHKTSTRTHLCDRSVHLHSCGTCTHHLTPTHRHRWSSATLSWQTDTLD